MTPNPSSILHRLEVKAILQTRYSVIGSDGSHRYHQSIIRHIYVSSKVRSGSIMYRSIIRLMSINHLHFQQPIFTSSTGRQRRAHDDIDGSPLNVVTLDPCKQLSKRLDERSWLHCTDCCTWEQGCAATCTRASASVIVVIACPLTRGRNCLVQLG